MTISRETVEATLREVVRENGKDYVYENHASSCTYTNRDGTPSCIVGHVIKRLNPSAFKILVRDEWYEVDNWDDEDAAPYWASKEATIDSLDTEFPDIVLDMDNETIEVLRTAQYEQDRGATWGKAIAEAGVPL